MNERVQSQVREAHLVLVTGDEFLRRREIDLLLSKKLPDSLKATNLNRVYPDDLSWPSLIDAARVPSLLGEMQVFWISGFDQLKTKKEDWSLFETYLEHPSERSFFIFEAEYLPKAHPVFGWIAERGVHKDFSIKGLDVGIRISKEKLSRAGKTMTQGAWQLLLEKMGGSPLLLDRSLDQLILYQDSDVIDEKSVQMFASEWLKYEPFQLTQALLERDAARALKLFDYFYELSEDVLSVIGLLHWQLRRLWIAKHTLAVKGDQKKLAAQLKIPPFRLQSFLADAARFNLEALENLINSLWELDWKVKTGALDGRLAVETFFAGVA